MKVEHKIEDEQMQEFREAADELKIALDNMFANWERTKTVMVYTVVGSSLTAFTVGFLVGRQSK